MTRYYQATFSDGLIAKRSTTSRHYTHAWRIGRITGFSGSAQLAVKASADYRHLADVVRDTAPCVEITSKEYRAK